MLLCIVLVAVAMAPVTSATWATTSNNRRYVMPGVSPNWVSYWGLSAQDAGGSDITGLKIWTDGTTEATDIEENFNGRRLYFATTEVRGLTLPETGSAFIDCAFCPNKAPIVPVGSLKTSYTLPQADTSADNFQVVVVAVEDNTQVTSQGTSPSLSVTLDAWKEKVILADQLPTEATLAATKPVAVFIFEKRSWKFFVRQLP